MLQEKSTKIQNGKNGKPKPNITDADNEEITSLENVPKVSIVFYFRYNFDFQPTKEQLDAQFTVIAVKNDGIKVKKFFNGWDFYLF